MADQEKDFPAGRESSRPGMGGNEGHGNITGGSDDKLLASYAVLQISPDASLEEVSTAYNNLKNTWREERFAQVDAWQDKAKVKLAEIENAHDTILKSLLDETAALSREPELIREDLSLVLPEEESPSDGGGEEDEPASPGKILGRIRDKIRGRSLTSSRGRRALAAALVILALAAGLFIWPTLYRYEVTPSGEQLDRLRINRLTSSVDRFDGSYWVPLPVPGKPPEETVLTAPPPLPSPVPSALPAEPAPAPPEPSVASLPRPSGQEETRRDIPVEKTPEGDLSRGGTEPTSADMVKVPRKKTPPPAAKAKPLPGGTYSIQVKAFREEAKARDFLKEIEARHADARLQRTVVKGQGVWYRVLIGHYQTRDQALADLKKQGMALSYPGSFVQKSGKGA